MTKKNVSEIRRTKENLEEYVVPDLLGKVMRCSQLILLSPVRLRCVDGRWAVRLSAWLIIFQRFWVFLTDFFVIMTIYGEVLLISQFTEENSITFWSLVRCCQTVIPMAIYSVCMVNSRRNIERNISILRQIHKMKSTVRSTKEMKSKKVQTRLLFAYMAWKIVMYAQATHGFTMYFYNNQMAVFGIGATLTFFQSLVIVFFTLELSLIIDEMRSTVSLLNDELHYWLETPSVTCIPHIRQNFMLHQKKKTNKVHAYKLSLQGPTVRPKISICHLGDCYYQICDLLRQINRENSIFLVVYITLMFMRLLVTLHNLTIAMELENMIKVMWELAWGLLHITEFLTLVEPSHRLQDQLERTRHLVGKLAGETGRWDLDFAHLEPFLLLVQIKRAALVPTGMYTVARPLLASIIGAVTTTSMMIFQFKKMSDRT